MLIIRHGESEADLRGVHEGRADFPLTSKGHAQAEAMSDYISTYYDVDRILVSTLSRAIQTAEHLSVKTGIPLETREELCEWNNGLLAGLPFREAMEKYPPTPGRPMHMAEHECESDLEFRFRIEAALSRILYEMCEGETIAVFSHGHSIALMYRAVLKLPVDSKTMFLTGDTGFHEWLLGDNGSVRVVRSNCTDHLRSLIRRERR